jgi:hypothetical protein
MRRRQAEAEAKTLTKRRGLGPSSTEDLFIAIDPEHLYLSVRCDELAGEPARATADHEHDAGPRIGEHCGDERATEAALAHRQRHHRVIRARPPAHSARCQ